MDERVGLMSSIEDHVHSETSIHPNGAEGSRARQLGTIDSRRVQALRSAARAGRLCCRPRKADLPAGLFHRSISQAAEIEALEALQSDCAGIERCCSATHRPSPAHWAYAAEETRN